MASLLPLKGAGRIRLLLPMLAALAGVAVASEPALLSLRGDGVVASSPSGAGRGAPIPVRSTFTPTSTPAPSATPAVRNLFNISGCVPHAVLGCGIRESGSIRLEPSGRRAAVRYGRFVFEDVAPGQYTLVCSPRCNPFGCRPPVQVTVVDDDVVVQFGQVHCPGDCGFDGVVSVDDLVRCATMALDGRPRCPTCDADRDGSVTVPDLIRAVNGALTDCRPDPSSIAVLRSAHGRR